VVVVVTASTGTQGGTQRTTQGTTDNRPIPTAQVVPNYHPGSGAQRAAKDSGAGGGMGNWYPGNTEHSRREDRDSGNGLAHISVSPGTAAYRERPETTTHPAVAG
jgi:hypothetical protein